MKRKIMNNRQIGVALFMYFGFYAVISNLEIMFLSDFINSDKILFLIIIMNDILSFVVITYVCKPLFENINYKVNFSIIIDTFKYYIRQIIWNIIAIFPLSFFIETETSKNQETVINLMTSNTIYTMFAILIFAPLIEELIFRGVIYKKIRRKSNVIISTMITSGLFAIMHFVVSIIAGDINDLIYIPIYIVPSVFLCIIYEKHNNIFAPILLHLITNSISTISIISTLY